MKRMKNWQRVLLGVLVGVLIYSGVLGFFSDQILFALILIAVAAFIFYWSINGK